MRGFRVTAFLMAALLSACFRYEHVNELEVPGLCPSEEERRIARERTPPIVYEPVTELASDSLRGRVVESDASGNELTARPVRSVQVHLLDTGRGALTDSVGRFAIAAPTGGPHVLRVLAIGYGARVDTLDAPLSAGSVIVIALRPMLLDGPCSGFAAVRVRKPWWKWW
jgi:hypothetical protein